MERLGSLPLQRRTRDPSTTIVPASLAWSAPPPPLNAVCAVDVQSTTRHRVRLASVPMPWTLRAPPPRAACSLTTPSTYTTEAHPDMFVSMRCKEAFPSTMMAPPRSAAQDEISPPVRLKKLVTPERKSAPPAPTLGSP
eukprot:2774527-Prymnesium_polylepis.1